MLCALATDFAALPGTTVAALQDHRIELPIDPACNVHTVADPVNEQTHFARLAQESDWTVVIAPEFDQLLFDRANHVLAVGGRLLGPSPDTIAIAANKTRLADLFSRTGVPTPEGQALDRGSRIPANYGFPVVLKQNDGAGSINVRLVDDPSEAAAIGHVDYESRIEQFVRGTAASVAVLCGPDGNHQTLAPCRQHLSDDGRFTYVGGSLPLNEAVAARASQLALAAVHSLPDALGYIGVDLVMGSASNADFVIEINPRLTTSYVGLRAACEQNLAMAILQVALGSSLELSYRAEDIRFSPSGKTWIDSTTS